jgi:hypothetical protein
MLDRAERLLDEIPDRGEDARREFDRLMGEINARDAAEPEIIRESGPERPIGDQYLPPGATASTTAPIETTPASTPRVTGRARLMAEQARDLHESGDYAGVIIQGQSYGYPALVRLLESHPPQAWLDQAQAGLNEQEDRVFRQRELREADAARGRALAAARSSEPTDAEDRERRELVEQATRDRDEHVAGRSARIEKLLQTIAERLERGQ